MGRVGRRFPKQQKPQRLDRRGFGGLILQLQLLQVCCLILIVANEHVGGKCLPGRYAAAGRYAENGGCSAVGCSIKCAIMMYSLVFECVITCSTHYMLSAAEIIWRLIQWLFFF